MRGIMKYFILFIRPRETEFFLDSSRPVKRGAQFPWIERHFRDMDAVHVLPRFGTFSARRSSEEKEHLFWFIILFEISRERDGLSSPCAVTDQFYYTSSILRKALGPYSGEHSSPILRPFTISLDFSREKKKTFFSFSCRDFFGQLKTLW